MRKNKLFVLGMLAMALASGLGFVGCDNGNGGGGRKIVTLTLAKLSPTSFSVTLNGANWRNDNGLITSATSSTQLGAIAGHVLDTSNCTIEMGFGIPRDSSLWALYDEFNWEVSGDLKTITATGFSRAAHSNLSGTLTFVEELGAAAGQVSPFGVTDGGLPVSALGPTVYIGTPSEGITFP
jgi:hypothetical protein